MRAVEGVATLDPTRGSRQADVVELGGSTLVADYDGVAAVLLRISLQSRETKDKARVDRTWW